MFALLLTRIVGRNSISTPIIRNIHKQVINCSSLSQIPENGIIKVSSATKENDTFTSVTKLLRSYEFTDLQIAKFFNKFPIKRSYYLTNVIKPKFDFFLEVGFSKPQLTKFVSSNPSLLKPSLEMRIKPNILLLKPFYETEERLVRSLFNSFKLLQSRLENNFFPNVRILTNHGVPHIKIIKLACQDPRILLKSEKEFQKMVQLVASKGFDPRSTLFCKALRVVSGTSLLTWKRKASLYKSLGWSEEDVVSAFLRQPYCMSTSEKKIKQTMNFFVNIRQSKPSLLAEHPVLFNLSLEKRVIPRCLVEDILMKKELVKKSSMQKYLISNKDFLEKYVLPYEDQAPEILHAYNGKLNSVCLDNESRIS